MNQVYPLRRGRFLAGSSLVFVVAMAGCNVEDVYLVPVMDDPGPASAVDAGSLPRTDAGPLPRTDAASSPDAAEDARTAPGTVDAADGCADSDAAWTLRIGVYIMADRSGSMGVVDPGNTDTRWSLAVNGISAFVTNPQTAGFEAGIQFFAQRDVSQFPFTTDCRPETYAMPAVAIDVLADNGAAIVTSLGAQGTDTPNPFMDETLQLETPTDVALQGASQRVLAWKLENSGSDGVVLLVTDGEPRSVTCNSSIETTIAAAEGALRNGVPTFVLGVGTNIANLDELARAGGTEKPYLATAEGVGDLITALDAHRTQQAACNPRP